MASTFDCLGFTLDGPDDLPALLDALRPTTVFEGRFGGVDIRWWEDPASGARVGFGERDGVLEFLLPCLAAVPTVRLIRIEARTPEVFGAAVVDGEGVERMSITFELEERHHLPGEVPDPTDAAVVAFGNSVSLSPGAPESFAPVGDAVAAAMLAGGVVECDTRVNSHTGVAFHVARVRVLGSELSVCLAVRDFPEPPAVGHVVAGSAFVVASIPSLRDAPLPRRVERAATPERTGKRWWTR